MMPTPTDRRSTENRQHAAATSWVRARARMVPNLLAQSPLWVRRKFDHAWAPISALTRQVRSLPAGLLHHLLAYEGGFVAITVAESRYAPGPATIRGRQVSNLAYISAQDLARDTGAPLRIIGCLIDHHLGCGGAPDGPWLSEGGGVTPGLREAGARLPGLYDLGYGFDDVARSSVRNYFAQSLAIYCSERQTLNVADPLITKWLRSTLWNESLLPPPDSETR